MLCLCGIVPHHSMSPEFALEVCGAPTLWGVWLHPSALESKSFWMRIKILTTAL